MLHCLGGSFSMSFSIHISKGVYKLLDFQYGIVFEYLIVLELIVSLF